MDLNWSRSGTLVWYAWIIEKNSKICPYSLTALCFSKWLCCVQVPQESGRAAHDCLHLHCLHLRLSVLVLPAVLQVRVPIAGRREQHLTPVCSYFIDKTHTKLKNWIWWLNCCWYQVGTAYRNGNLVEICWFCEQLDFNLIMVLCCVRILKCSKIYSRIRIGIRIQPHIIVIF